MGNHTLTDGELLLADFIREKLKHLALEWSDELGTWVIYPPKKPYTKPVLRVYGDIKNMTETSTMGMHADAHGRRSIHKTA